MEVFIAILVGCIAGLHTSTWGMYKDAPYEGFTWLKYFRSTVIGGIVGLGIYLVVGLDVTKAPDLVVFFGFTYVIERALVEFYKTFLRVEDQSKYFIPMQFSVKGEVVESRATQLAVGFSWAGVVFVLLAGMAYAQQNGHGPTGLMAVLAVGSLGGWISAFGGAWKDAPKEGFQIFKFFRSPLIALMYAFLLANFTKNYILISMGALGYTIATIETYKTFFFPSRPRGKFQGKKIKFPEFMTRRYYFVPVYVAIWIAVLTTIVIAFMGPREGWI